MTLTAEDKDRLIDMVDERGIAARAFGNFPNVDLQLWRPTTDAVLVSCKLEYVRGRYRWESEPELGYDFIQDLEEQLDRDPVDILNFLLEHFRASSILRAVLLAFNDKVTALRDFPIGGSVVRAVFDQQNNALDLFVLFGEHEYGGEGIRRAFRHFTEVLELDINSNFGIGWAESYDNSNDELIPCWVYSADILV